MTENIDFSGKVKDEYTDWKERTEKKLEEQKRPDRIVSKKGYFFWKFMCVLFFILILGSAGFYGYEVYKGKFQSIDNSVCNPNLTCPESPSCPSCPTCPACVNNCNPNFNLTIKNPINST